MLSLSWPDRVKLLPWRPLPLAEERVMRVPVVDELLRTPWLLRKAELLERPRELDVML